MTSYYNEVDKHAAAWLRELVKAGHIADGIVDERDIQDVLPSDLAGFTQCHFFAGIGVWSYALGLAGWPDDQPVWTGSCPCQPFSAAGKGDGFADERHLWPAFHHLIKECRPPVVFGEQVASKDADTWIDLVQTDLEAVGYAVGAVPFPSASVGAPHIRDRLYWVADASGARLDQRKRVAGIPGRKTGADARQTAVGNGVCSVVGMAYSDGRDAGAERQQCRREQRQQPQDDSPMRMAYSDDDGPLDGVNSTTRRRAKSASEYCCALGLANDDQHGCGADPIRGGDDAEHHAEPCGESGGLADAESLGKPANELRGHCINGEQLAGTRAWGNGVNDGRDAAQQPTTGPVNGFWRDADWLLCRDGKWRPVEPGTFPLVDGAAARVVRLRGYGNAINAVQAKAFIEAFMGYQQQVSA